nr:PA14 domain-containing protein [Oscillochloris sp. ZM17-4]
MVVSNPASSSTVQGVVNVNGWAIDLNATQGTGIDGVRIYATTRRGEQLLGNASYGLPDSTSHSDSRFTNSGFSLNVDTATLLNGSATLRVEQHSTISNQWTSQNIPVTINNPVPTCAPDSYQAEYFANVTLTGPPAFTRCESQINYDWGVTSPGGGLGTDNYSAQWTSNPTLAAGTYTFSVRADDGVRVWVDGELIIDRWYSQHPTNYWVTRTLAAGTHQIRVTYVEYTGSAVIQFHYGQEAPPSIPAAPDTCPPGYFRAEYFDNKTLAGTPAFVRCEDEINRDWSQGNVGYNIGSNAFSARWSGRLQFSAGMYDFTLNADDGARLWLDGEQIIDMWSSTATRPQTVSRAITYGPHTLRVEYFDDTGGASVQLRFSSTISTVSPDSAIANAGDVPIVIKGVAVQDIASIRIGGVNLTQLKQPDSTTIQAVVPSAALLQGAGAYDVVAVDASGRETRIPQGFTVKPPDPVQHLVRVMVVLACDNNLGQGTRNSCRELLDQLELAVHANPTNLSIAVLLDEPGPNNSYYYMVQPDAQPHVLFDYQEGVNRFHVPGGEVDTGDPNTLISFAGWAQGQSRGTYKFLSLVGHGGGWAPSFPIVKPRFILHKPAAGGILIDDTPWNLTTVYPQSEATTSLATRPMADALRAIADGYTLDVLYLDACLMSAVEVMAELGPRAQTAAPVHYVVAHENLSYALHIYEPYLRGIANDTSASAFSLQIAKAVRDSWNSNALPDDPPLPAEVNVIDTTQMPAVTTAVDQLGQALLLALPTQREDITAAIQSTLHLDENDDGALNTKDGFVDLVGLSNALLVQPGLPKDIRDAAAAVLSAVPEVLPKRYTQDGPSRLGLMWPIQQLGGLSIYLPLAYNNRETRAYFYNVASLPVFAGSTAWDEFIQAWLVLPTDAEIPAPSVACNDDCLITPRHITLKVAPPAVAAPNDLIQVPVIIEGVTSSDDLYGIQFEVMTSDKNVLEPATNKKPTITITPSHGLLVDFKATELSWTGLLQQSSSVDTPLSGNRKVVNLPFYARGQGCADLTITQHLLLNRDAGELNHYILPAQVCVGPSGVGGSIFLEHRPRGPFTGAQVTLSNTEKSFVVSTDVDASGAYVFTDVPPGSYQIVVHHPLYMLAERDIVVNASGMIAVPAIGLWAGDMNQNRRISRLDWRVCSAASIPIDDPTFDIDVDGSTNLRDCMFVERNIGRSAMATTNPTYLTSASANSLAAVGQATNQLATDTSPINITVDSASTAIIAVNQGADAFFGMGLRLQLPFGITVDQVIPLDSRITADGIIWHQEGQRLYLIVAVEGDQPLQSPIDLVQLHFQGTPAGGDMIITQESGHLVSESGPLYQVFIPLIVKQ